MTSIDPTPREPRKGLQRPSWILILGVLAVVFMVLSIVTSPTQGTRDVTNVPGPSSTQVE